MRFVDDDLLSIVPDKWYWMSGQGELCKNVRFVRGMWKLENQHRRFGDLAMRTNNLLNYAPCSPRDSGALVGWPCCHWCCSCCPRGRNQQGGALKKRRSSVLIWRPRTDSREERQRTVRQVPCDREAPSVPFCR